MHAVEVLREDHDRIAALVGRLALAEEDDPRLFDLLRSELTVHLLAEDNVFLPQVEEAIEDGLRAMRGFFDGDALAGSGEIIAGAYENHREIRSLLARGPRDGIGDLKLLVERQVELEESLYPRAEKVLEEEDFERIGDLIEHCKWQVRGLAQAKLASSSSFRPPDRTGLLSNGGSAPLERA
ncbi:MAG TPA: hypothetical protein VKA73_14580 [Rubrobacter sp.]|nr:hypothetical protein [Rubrobacter sp.]